MINTIERVTFIVVHALLPHFRADIFHFTKFKLVSNRLPLFSFPYHFRCKFTSTGCRCFHSRIYFPPFFYPLPRGPTILNPITLIRSPPHFVYIKHHLHINKIDSFLDWEGLLTGFLTLIFRYASAHFRPVCSTTPQHRTRYFDKVL